MGLTGPRLAPAQPVITAPPSSTAAHGTPRMKWQPSASLRTVSLASTMPRVRTADLSHWRFVNSRGCWCGAPPPPYGLCGKPHQCLLSGRQQATSLMLTRIAQFRYDVTGFGIPIIRINGEVHTGFATYELADLGKLICKAAGVADCGCS